LGIGEGVGGVPVRVIETEVVGLVESLREDLVDWLLIFYKLIMWELIYIWIRISLEIMVIMDYLDPFPKQ
jgi:hypothetical protein